MKIRTLRNQLIDMTEKEVTTVLTPTGSYQILGLPGSSLDIVNSLLDDLEEDEKENGWIPVKYHQISEKERAEEFLSKDIQYMLDCKMPDDGQEILVTNGETTWQDTCFIDSNGYYLDGGYDWIDIMAWMPLPKPYKEG